MFWTHTFWRFCRPQRWPWKEGPEFSCRGDAEARSRAAQALMSAWITGVLVKMQFLTQWPGFCISIQLPGDASAAGPRSTLWVARSNALVARWPTNLDLPQGIHCPQLGTETSRGPCSDPPCNRAQGPIQQESRPSGLRDHRPRIEERKWGGRRQKWWDGAGTCSENRPRVRLWQELSETPGPQEKEAGAQTRAQAEPQCQGNEHWPCARDCLHVLHRCHIHLHPKPLQSRP